MQIAETIYTFKRSFFFFYLFSPCPATFGLCLSEENSRNQLNNWKKSSLLKKESTGRHTLYVTPIRHLILTLAKQSLYLLLTKKGPFESVDGFSYLHGFSVIILSNKNHLCFSELALNPTMPVGLVSTN
jgi:hypothetical protein